MKKLIITKEQYNGLVRAGLIKESAPMVKGGINRTQKEFNKGFAGKDIKAVTEDGQFNIKAPNADLPKGPQKPAKPAKHITENEKGGKNKISKEITDLLKHLYGKDDQFNSDYWVGEKGKSCQEIEEVLTDKGLIVKKGRNFIVPTSIGTKEEAKAAIEECIREFVGEPMEEIEEDYPLGAEHHPNAPYNQEDPEPIDNHTDYDIFVFNDGMAVLNQGTEFFLLDFYKNDVDYEGREMTEDDINLFLNNNERELPNILIPLDIDLIDELGEMYNLNAHFMKKLEQIKTILGGMSEGVDWSKAYPREKARPKMNDVSPKKRTGPENQAIIDKVHALRQRELSSREDMKSQHPTDQPEELDETGCAGAMGVGSPVVPMGTPIKRDIKTVYETLSVGGAGNFQYDNPGLAGVAANGDFKKSRKKTKAETTPQWAGGAFVEQPECSKPNNNKEAQNGGCNSGASSLKTKKASGSVNAPSLSENKIFEEIAKRTGKTIEEVKQIISNKK